MKTDDIYTIAGRIKNIIANKNIALSPTGNILVNTYALVLKDLQDFAQTLPDPYADQLKELIISKEGLPEYVIGLSTPKKEKTLYEQVMESKPLFETNEKALEHFTKEYEDLGQEYGMSGDDFWMEAENSSSFNEDYRKITKLRRSIHMCKYLIEKEKTDG